MKKSLLFRVVGALLLTAIVSTPVAGQVFTSEDAVVARMADEFQGMVKREGLVVVRTALKGIRLEGTEVSGPISPWLEKRVTDAILLNSREPVRLQVVDLGLFQKIDPDFVRQNPKLMSLNNVDAFIYGEYSKRGQDLFLTLDLVSMSDQHTLGRFQGTLAGKMLPTLPLEPVNLTQTLQTSQALDNQIANPAKAALDASTKPLKVSISSSRGNGASFSDGESITVVVSATKDAYFKLYHIDVKGQVQLIFPNRFQKDNFVKAGTLVQFPAANASFRFQLHEPFGTEFVKAVASTLPFETTESDFEELGSLRSGVMAQGMRAVDLVKAETAEAKMNYTINPR